MSLTTNPSTTPQDNRLTVDLPLRNGNKEKFEKLGITWTHIYPGLTPENPFLGKAQLPQGWEVINNLYFSDGVNHDITIVDSNETPKARVFYDIAWHHQTASVQVIGTEDALQVKEQLEKKSELIKQFQNLDKIVSESTSDQSLKEARENLNRFTKEHPEFKNPGGTPISMVNCVASNILMKSGDTKDCKTQ
ncbi:MAG: hypothetical protein K1000chlam3_01001 [Chlamydiae bacterium]|nr:hypothetical protein [Chlamydiota bacterium]